MQERTFSSNADMPTEFPHWGAIWAGTFSFIAIWSVFGFLGIAIFASVVHPTASMGMGVGIGIWAVVLTIAALFVAGRTTGRLARKTDAVINGTVTFGLSVASLLAIAVLAELALGQLLAASGGIHALGTSSALAGLGWIGFVALFLGWFASVAGAWSAQRHLALGASSESVRRAA